jgi:DNA-binding NarL/FixJ family response regulator
VKAPCQALVLEDDPGQLERVAAVIREAGLEPILTRSPDQALTKLHHYHPVLAVVDLDMSLAPPGPRSVADLLRHLHERCGGCCVLVYSVGADQIEERKRVESLHPLALFVSKQDGPEALVNRIRRTIGARYGDLSVRRGLVFHEPSGEVYSHHVGVSLVMGAVLGQEVVLNDREAKAARRMRSWLARVGSPVQILDYGRRCYALHLAEERG